MIENSLPEADFHFASLPIEVLARHPVEVENVVRAKGEIRSLEPRLDLSGDDTPRGSIAVAAVNE